MLRTDELPTTWRHPESSRAERKLFTLGSVARFAEQHRRSVRDILEQREWLDAFIVALPDSRCYAFSVSVVPMPS